MRRVSLWEKVHFCKTAKEKNAVCFFQIGLVFTCTRRAGRLCWLIKYAGVQGHTRHTRMIDGSVWMLKSTKREHVSAARPGLCTQHLFKGQVLQNTLTVQLLPLSSQSSTPRSKGTEKPPHSFAMYMKGFSVGSHIWPPLAKQYTMDPQISIKRTGSHVSQLLNYHRKAHSFKKTIWMFMMEEKYSPAYFWADRYSNQSQFDTAGSQQISRAIHIVYFY